MMIKKVNDDYKTLPMIYDVKGVQSPSPLPKGQHFGSPWLKNLSVRWEFLQMEYRISLSKNVIVF